MLAKSVGLAESRLHQMHAHFKDVRKPDLEWIIHGATTAISLARAVCLWCRFNFGWRTIIESFVISPKVAATATNQHPTKKGRKQNQIRQVEKFSLHKTDL